MSEKIRGAIFNALGDIKGLSVLDAYAGTGALSIEAISRGALGAQAIDADQAAVRTMHENAEKLGIEDKLAISKAFAIAWSRRNQSKMYDIVILGPPYDAVEPKELLKLTSHCKKGGLIIISLPPNNGFLLASSKQELLVQKNYGDAEISIYRQL